MASSSSEGIHSLHTRCVPKSLYEAIKSMNGAQKEAVSDMGFKSLLSLNIKKIPGALAVHVVNMLDTDAMIIKTANGGIPINRMAVHEVLGFPMGNIHIDDDRRSNYKDVISVKWKNEMGESVKPAQVLKEIQASQSDDLMFRIKFLVLMVSTLVKAMKNGDVNRQFLKSIDEDSVINSFDWCGYVEDSVKHCKDDLKPNSQNSVTFTGPITFLVLLYCDRLLVGPPIERKRPVIARWLSGDLDKRQKKEVDSGSFGSGDLLLEWRETPEGQEYLKTMLAEHSHRDVHFDSCGCRDDGGEEQTEQGVVKRVLKVLEDAVKVLEDGGKQIDDAVDRFGDNKQLQSIKKTWDSAYSNLVLP